MARWGIPVSPTSKDHRHLVSYRATRWRSSSRWGVVQLEEGLTKILEEETLEKKIAGPEEMLVGEVPERDRSAEAEQSMKH